ncbi:DUF3958 family protein [Listeria booriae]|uniref:DUF3958 family protein n=1 Tax=Listeria booriae TaxID=1552123 RepID=UPI0016234C28|nr:DUF3958 family protein [Listeria booriae]MBC2149782.1 DUF3958 family protein [Listeria booriae]
MEKQEQKINGIKQEINQAYNALDEAEKQSRTLEQSWEVLHYLKRTRNKVSDALSRGWRGTQGRHVAMEQEDNWRQESQRFQLAFEELEEQLATEKKHLNQSIDTAEYALKKAYEDEVSSQ